MRPGFNDREILKFVQANFFKLDKVGEKIFNHWNWLDTLETVPRLNPQSLRMLQSGAFYIYGRDKFYRPCVIIDAAVLNKLNSEPGIVTAENFNALWIFLYVYMRKVMFLDGQVDMWMTLVNFGNLGVSSLPRKPILAFADVCQSNMMYFMAKSYYVNVSWGQRTLYKGLSSFINEETKAKISLTGDMHTPELVDLFHPEQLERRFGGTGESPTNFWPPY